MHNILHQQEDFAISPAASKLHVLHKTSLQENLMGWICSKLNEIFFLNDEVFIGDGLHCLNKTTLVSIIHEHFPISLVSSDSEFEDKGSLQSLALGWWQILVLFSWLIMNPSNL